MDGMLDTFSFPHHSLHFSSSFKKRAPKTIKIIREFAKRTMGTAEVHLDASINGHVWSKGVRSVPRRIRVKLERCVLFLLIISISFSKPNEAEDAKEAMYTMVTFVPIDSFKNLETKVVE
jgi:large subunit ribosomal protein L31e